MSREQNHAPFRGDLSSLRRDLIWSPFLQNLRALASAIPEIWIGPPKFKTCHVTQPRPFQGRFVVRQLELATINLYTKYEVSMFTHYEPHLHLSPPIPFEFRRELWCQNTRVKGLSYGIICVILHLAVLIQYWRVTDTHVHGQTDGRTDTRRRHFLRICAFVNLPLA